MAKVKCRPERVSKQGEKRVKVKTHTRSKPVPIRKKCSPKRPH